MAGNSSRLTPEFSIPGENRSATRALGKGAGLVLHDLIAAPPLRRRSWLSPGDTFFFRDDSATRSAISPMSPTIARKTLSLFREHFHKTNLVENYNLSKREKEILKCLVEGSSYKITAQKCGIANETVKSHVRNIYEKLHVTSMSGAVAKAIRENLT